MSLGGEGVAFFVVIIIFTVLCSACLLLRWWSATIQGRRFQVDDGLLIAAWVTILTYEGTATWTIFNGLGQADDKLTAADIIVTYKDVVAAMVCWTIATVLVKLAILSLYTRIFSTRNFRRWAWFIMALVICFGITYFGFAMTTCIPLSELWQPVAGGHCRDLVAQEIGSMVPNLFLDVCVLVLPMPWLWKLQMPLKNKLWITLMFSLGIVNMGVMCYRLYAAIHPSANTSSGNATQGIFSFLELWIGVIVACMPTMAPVFITYVKPLASTIRTRLFGSRGSDDYSARNKHSVLDPAVNTFHRHPESRKHRSNYSSLDDDTGIAMATYDRSGGRADSGELALVGQNTTSKVQTECTTAPEMPQQTREGIYVRKDFQTQWNNA